MVSPYRGSQITTTSLQSLNRELFGQFWVLPPPISLPGHSGQGLKSRQQKKQQEHNTYVHFLLVLITYSVTNSNYSPQTLLSVLKDLQSNGLLSVSFSLNFASCDTQTLLPLPTRDIYRLQSAVHGSLVPTIMNFTDNPMEERSTASTLETQHQPFHLQLPPNLTFTGPSITSNSEQLKLNPSFLQISPPDSKHLLLTVTQAGKLAVTTRQQININLILIYQKSHYF